MTITETALVFAGIPLAAVAAVYALVYGTSARKADKRYRPGRPLRFTPVWFLSAPSPLAEQGADHGSPAPAVTGAAARPALSPGENSGENEREPALAQHGEVGGASDSW